MISDFDEWFKLEQEKLEKKFFDQVQERILAGEKFDDPKANFEKKIKKLIQKKRFSW